MNRRTGRPFCPPLDQMLKAKSSWHRVWMCPCKYDIKEKTPLMRKEKKSIYKRCVPQNTPKQNPLNTPPLRTIQWKKKKNTHWKARGINKAAQEICAERFLNTVWNSRSHQFYIIVQFVGLETIEEIRFESEDTESMENPRLRDRVLRESKLKRPPSYPSSSAFLTNRNRPRSTHNDPEDKTFPRQ